MINFATKIVGGHVPMKSGFSNFPLLRLQSWLNKKVWNMYKKLTQKEFLEKCYQKYGNKYDFSLSTYNGSKCKVKYVCNGCGTVYEKTAAYLINNDFCCSFCHGKGRAKNTDQFIKKAKKIHGDKYDYSKVNYVNAHTKVCIVCPIHGEFWQTPNSHLNGRGCQYCGKIKQEEMKISLDTAIERSKKIFGEQYDYEKSKKDYKDVNSYVTVTCLKHGDFKTKFLYLFRGNGCAKCAAEHRGEKLRMNEDEWRERANERHKGKYTYDNAHYTKSNEYVYVTCKEHGDFKINAASHLYGNGCPICAHKKNGERCRLTKDEFIKRSEKLYEKGTYIYDDVDYKGMIVPVKITCPTHGVFFKRPIDFLKGCGCPICGLPHGEQKIVSFLKSSNIEFERQYKIYNESLLCERSVMYVDFYIPSKNTIIEYNGEQHYKEGYFHKVGNTTFEQQQYRDESVRSYCKNHGIKLIEIPYWDFNNIEKILKQKLKKISSYGSKVNTVLSNASKGA